MLTRFLGGAVTCLGAAGMLFAQQPQYTQPAQIAQNASPQYNPQPASPTYASPASQLIRGSRTPAIRTVQAVPDTAPGAVQALPTSTLRADPAAPPAAVAAPPAAAAAAPATAANLAPQTPSSNLLTQGGCGVTSCPSYADCTAAPGCSTCCTPCGPYGRNWIDAGWIFWTTSGQNLPPLVTAAPAGTPRPVAGVIGQPTTSLLYPTSKVNSNFRSGFYLNAGHWFDECQTRGIEGNFLYLGNASSSYSASDPGTGVLTRPFFNTALGANDTQLVAFPNVLSGSIATNASTSLIGGGGNFVRNLCCGPCGRFDLLLGFQYMNVTDEVVINENLTSLPGQTNVTPGTQFLVEDRFKTSNNFYGGNIGFATERRWSHWYVGLRAGVALGVNHQVTDISGFTTITPPGGPSQTYSGGLLAQPSNIGHYTRDQFAVMPWVGLKLGCQLTERLRVYVGYDFFALTNVARAGDQIDLRVNPTQIPPRTNGVSGPAFPQYTPKDSTFVGQGIRIGAEFRF